MSLAKIAVISSALIVTSASLIACNATKPNAMPAAYPGYSGDYPGFTLMIDDRFDKFEQDIWHKGDCGFMEPASRFVSDNVQVNNGTMKLIINKEKL